MAGEVVVTFSTVAKWAAGLGTALFTAAIVGSVSYIRGMDTGIRTHESRIIRLETEQESLKAELSAIRRLIERMDTKLERILERRQ